MPDTPDLRSAAEYHGLAERTRKKAAGTCGGSLRRAYDRLADSYDQLSQQVDKTKAQDHA